MRTELVVVLAVQAMVFLVFIVCAFRWLFALRRDAVTKSGNSFPGLGATIWAFREGLRDPRYSRLRTSVAVSALLLLGTAFLTPSLTQA